jgi:hypothetical protein
LCSSFDDDHDNSDDDDEDDTEKSKRKETIWENYWRHVLILMTGL